MNNYTLKETEWSAAGGGGSMNETVLTQSDEIPSPLPKSVFSKEQTAVPVEPVDPQGWIGISKQAIFLVVNNQVLRKDQLGGPHLFFETLEFIHLPLLKLKSRVQGIQWERPIFCPSDVLGWAAGWEGGGVEGGWGFVFVSSPLRIRSACFQASLDSPQPGPGWDFWTMPSHGTRPERKLRSLRAQKLTQVQLSLQRTQLTWDPTA